MEDQKQPAPEASPSPPIQDYPPVYPPAPRNPLQKSPLLAGFLSFMPGLGNVYNGLYTRGITFFFIWAGVLAITIRTGNRSHGDSEALALLIPSVVFIWLFNLFDAYRQASLINHGYANDLGLEDSGRFNRAPGGMMLGVVVLGIGLYGLLQQLFDFDLTLLLDYWHVAFIGFGIWLIIQARQAKASEASSQTIDGDD